MIHPPILSTSSRCSRNSDNGEVIETYSVIGDVPSKTFKVVSGYEEDAIAWALYQGSPEYNGWIYLSVNTSGSYDDVTQAMGCGYLEGYLTYDHLWNHRYNYLSNQFNSTEMPAKLVDWIQINIGYMKTMITSNPNSQYWYSLNLTLNQLESIVNGYNDANSNSDQKLGIEDVFLVNMFGDLFDLDPAIGLGLSYFSKKNIEEYLMRSQHCSAIVKLADDLSELFAGHNTWSEYSTMIRIFKSYYFSYNSQLSGTLARSISFSSYPGVIISIDDFYQMVDTSLVVLETTNSLITNDLYHLITPSSVLSFIRIMNANRMASDGLSWCQIFSVENSGTYNNQYMVIDYKKFVPYKALHDGALYVIEQIPGQTVYQDETQILRTGYWPSFNIPFFESIYNLSGYNTYVYPSGTPVEYLSYVAAPRSQLFRRNANQIFTIEDFQDFIRYNNWEYDPLSYGNPYYAISSRQDLDPKKPQAFGGLDAKITSSTLLYSGTVYAISGPTTNQQPPFDWNSQDWNATHIGMPSLWNFDWVQFKNNTYSYFEK
eukprot:gene4173-5223_t